MINLLQDVVTNFFRKKCELWVEAPNKYCMSGKLSHLYMYTDRQTDRDRQTDVDTYIHTAQLVKLWKLIMGCKCFMEGSQEI